VTLKCHEPRTYSAVKRIYSTNAPRDRLLEYDRPEDRGRLQEAEALAVVFPQAHFLTPSDVSADPVDPPFMQAFENLKIYNLYDRAFPFVTFAHHLQRPSSRPSWRPTSTNEPLQHKVLVLLQLIYVNSHAQHTAYGQRMYRNWKRMHYNKDQTRGFYTTGSRRSGVRQVVSKSRQCTLDVTVLSHSSLSHTAFTHGARTPPPRNPISFSVMSQIQVLYAAHNTVRSTQRKQSQIP